jgi:hypothetical protein
MAQLLLLRSSPQSIVPFAHWPFGSAPMLLALCRSHPCSAAAGTGTLGWPARAFVRMCMCASIVLNAAHDAQSTSTPCDSVSWLKSHTVVRELRKSECPVVVVTIWNEHGSRPFTARPPTHPPTRPLTAGRDRERACEEDSRWVQDVRAPSHPLCEQFNHTSCNLARLGMAFV